MSFSINQLVIFAALAGNLHLLEKRVSAGGNVNYNDSKHGSALIAAITPRHCHILDWLITNNADVNVQYHDGFGLLEIALRNPDTEIVYRLICAEAKLTHTARPHFRKQLDDCLKEYQTRMHNS